MYELTKFRFRLQDEKNIDAMPTARLTQLTFNINRGEKTNAIESFTQFLPYPQRYEALEQLQKIEGFSVAAAQDFANYYQNGMSDDVKKAFYNIKQGLFEKCKK